MSTNLTIAADGLTHRTRFVLVNGRVPRADEHCALCGGIMEKSYVRDSQTRLIYCDTRRFAGGAHLATGVTRNRARKESWVLFDLP
jgi:hypothetical protein